MAGEHPRAGVDYPRSWHELLGWFGDEGACLRYLERLRWGECFTCRFCAVVEGGWWRMADGFRRCAACMSETSVTAGTIFAGTRTPLVSWFASGTWSTRSRGSARWASARPRAGQLPDRVGVAAQTASRDGAPRTRAAHRRGRGL